MTEVIVGVALCGVALLLALAVVRRVALSRARRRAEVQGQTFDGFAEMWGLGFRERSGDGDGGSGDGGGGGGD